MRTLRSWSPLLLVLLASACRHDIPSLEPRLASTPPSRLRFQSLENAVLTERVSSSLRRASVPGEQVAEMTTTTRLAPEPQGWRLTQQVTHASLSRNAVPVKTLVEEVLVRAPLQIRLATDGTFVRLEEPGAALAALSAVRPAGLDVTALERLFAPEALEARTRAEWEVKYGGLYGRPLEPGQRVLAVGTVELGGREVTYLLERLFTGWRLTEHGETWVFALRCLEAPGEEAPPEVRDVLNRAGDPEVTPGVTCEGEQLLGQSGFLPVRRGFTLRATLDGETWTWATQAALESVRTPEEEQR